MTTISLRRTWLFYRADFVAGLFLLAFFCAAFWAAGQWAR